MDNPKITPRLEELHQASRQRHEITVDSLTLELETARIMAIEGDRPSTAVAATMGKAKLHGLLIDKQEDVTSRTRDELIARATELLHKRGIGLTTS